MPKNYDFVAPFYPILEKAAFGELLTEARLASVGAVVSGERVLMIGEGNGRFLAECLKEKRGGSITVVDSSEKMLSSLRTRIQKIETQTKVELVHADFREWSPVEAGFDVVVTHFFLEVFRPPSQRRFIEKITALSTMKATWMNVEFRPVLQSRIHRLIDWLQYRFDRLLSGTEADRNYDCGPVIQEHGWEIREEQQFCGSSVCSRLLRRSGRVEPVPG
jgi:ubiquinone/menaquinone biosynthesis C-methylase UbiE